MASVHLERVFKGPARAGETIAVIAVGHRPTLDPTRPSIPYFQKGTSGRFVFFLGQREGGMAWLLEDLLAARGAEGEARVHAVEAVSRLAAMSDARAKSRETLRWSLQALRSPSPWLAGLAARDLYHLANLDPSCFDEEAVARMRRAAETSAAPDPRWWLGRAIQQVTRGSSATAEDAAGTELDAWQRAFLRAPDAEARAAAVLRVLEDRSPAGLDRLRWGWAECEPTLRVQLVEASALLDRRDLLDEWMRLYAGEEDVGVRVAMLDGVGRLGSPEHVAWLGERVASPLVRRAALLALARIRSPEALDRLRQAATVLDRGEASERELSEWIRWLASDSFKDQEETSGAEPK